MLARTCQNLPHVSCSVGRHFIVYPLCCILTLQWSSFCASFPTIFEEWWEIKCCGLQQCAVSGWKASHCPPTAKRPATWLQQSRIVRGLCADGFRSRSAQGLFRIIAELRFGGIANATEKSTGEEPWTFCTYVSSLTTVCAGSCTAVTIQKDMKENFKYRWTKDITERVWSRDVMGRSTHMDSFESQDYVMFR